MLIGGRIATLSLLLMQIFVFCFWKPQRNQRQYSNLACESFCWSNCILTTCVQKYSAVGASLRVWDNMYDPMSVILPGDKRSNDINYRKYWNIFLQCDSHCTVNIFGFSTLRNNEQHSIRSRKMYFFHLRRINYWVCQKQSHCRDSGRECVYVPCTVSKQFRTRISWAPASPAK